MEFAGLHQTITRFFRSSKGGAWPKWPNGKHVTARLLQALRRTP